MKSFNEVARELKLIYEDLSPEEVERLQKISNQTQDRSKKIKEILEGNGWNVSPGFIIKDGVNLQVEKDDHINAYVKISADSPQVKVDIEFKKDALKGIDTEDLKQLVVDLEGLIKALN